MHGSRQQQSVGSVLDQLLKDDQEETLEDLAEGYADSDEDDEDLDDDSELLRAVTKQQKEMEDEHTRALQEGAQAGHQPLFLSSILHFLGLQQNGVGGTFLDCTFGRGGHSREILKRLNKDARLVAFDVDKSAMPAAQMLQNADPRFEMHYKSFVRLPKVLPGVSFKGALINSGFTSDVKVDPQRGMRCGPLDLRFNQRKGKAASEFLQGATVKKLASILRKYTGDSFDKILADRLAQTILDHQERSGRPYQSITEFEAVVEQTLEASAGGAGKSAKVVLGALRRFVNRELQELARGLRAVFDQLEHGCRCAIITQCHLERTVVYDFARALEAPCPQMAAKLDHSRLCQLYPIVAKEVSHRVVKEYVLLCQGRVGDETPRMLDAPLLVAGEGAGKKSVVSPRGNRACTEILAVGHLRSDDDEYFSLVEARLNANLQESGSTQTRDRQHQHSKRKRYLVRLAWPLSL